MQSGFRESSRVGGPERERRSHFWDRTRLAKACLPKGSPWPPAPVTIQRSTAADGRQRDSLRPSVAEFRPSASVAAVTSAGAAPVANHGRTPKIVSAITARVAPLISAGRVVVSDPA